MVHTAANSNPLSTKVLFRPHNIGFTRHLDLSHLQEEVDIRNPTSVGPAFSAATYPEQSCQMGCALGGFLPVYVTLAVWRPITITRYSRSVPGDA